MWTELPESAYEVSYINNVDRGRAMILVNGTGPENVGSRTARFTVDSMRMWLFSLISTADRKEK